MKGEPSVVKKTSRASSRALPGDDLLDLPTWAKDGLRPITRMKVRKAATAEIPNGATAASSKVFFPIWR